MRAALVSLGLVTFSNLHCAPLESTATRESPKAGGITIPEGTPVAAKSDSDGVVTAAIDPYSLEPQLLKASEGSNISDVVLAFPPGALAIGADITLREGASLGSNLLLQDLGLPDIPSISNSAAAVEVFASEAVDLKVPMILALPIPVGFSLTASASLGVLYRVAVQATGENIVGFVPASELSFRGNTLLYPSRYFGSFQVVVFDQVVPKVEKANAEPLLDGVQYVLRGFAIPPCGKADIGKTIFVEETKLFQYCGSNGWVIVDLKGPPGPQGLQGPQGPQGLQGATGTSGSGGSGGILNIGLYDANNTKVGRYLGNNQLRNYYVQLADGTNIQLDGAGNIVPIASPTCAYSTSDCTGSCVVQAYAYSQTLAAGDYVTIQGKDIGGTNVHTIAAKLTGPTAGTFFFNSIWQNGMNYCSTYSSSFTGYLSYSSYSPSLSVTPPFAIRAEP